MGDETLKVIDLRSDTVTHPTEQMREAMAKAPVGDDVYGEDPTINELEERAAALLGKEKGLFVPSGTMGNCLAVLAHTQRGDEVILEAESHIYFYEVGGMAALGGLQPRLVPGKRGILDPVDVEKVMRPPDMHFPRTSLLCLENTHNRGGGAVTPLETLARLKALAEDRGLAVHMDGARIFNAAVHLGVEVSAIAHYADSIMFCLSKGLSAPVGSMVVGSSEWMPTARRYRKMLGGGMRQGGIVAAAGLVALDSMIDRLKEDHENAAFLARELSRLDGVDVDVENVETNIVFIDVSGSGKTAATVASALKEHSVLCNAAVEGRLRLVTHKDVDRKDIERAVEVFAEVIA